MCGCKLTGVGFCTECSSAWLERPVWGREVGGSNPLTPITVNFGDTMIAFMYVMRVWAVLGFIFMVFSKSKVTSKKKAFVELLLAGPICWVFLPLVHGFNVWEERHNKNKAAG